MTGAPGGGATLVRAVLPTICQFHWRFVRMADISVIIPTKNAGGIFGDVLAGLRGQTFSGGLEIVVVDSGSTDQTLELARQYGCIVHKIDPAEFDHGATRDRAIGFANAPVVILMTQDAVPANENLVQALHACFHDQRVAGAYARQIPRTQADVLTTRNVNNHLTGRGALVVQEVPEPGALARLPPLERYVACNFDNVCSAVRRSAWENTRFGKCDFGEDLVWAKRVLEAGWKILYEPSAAVIHSHDRSLRYEYQRTYMCHRKLFELFEVATVPAARYVPRCLLAAVVQDSVYVIKNESRFRQRLRLLLRIPAMSVASVFGQYRGARDQRLARGRKHAGV